MKQEDIQYHLDIEHAVAKAAQLLICGRDADLNSLLKILGKAVDVNRAYIFQFHDDGRKMDNTYEWCSPGTQSQIDNLQDLEAAPVPWWMNKLKHGEDILIPAVDKLPPQAHTEKMILQAQDIKSLLVVPINSRRGLLGFLGFDDTEKYRTWRNHDARLLHVISQMIGSEFDRRQAEDTLRESEHKYRSLAEMNPNPIFLVDHEGRHLYMNLATYKLLGVGPEDAIGRTIEEIIPEEDAKWMRENILRVFRERKPFTEEQQITVDNKLHYFLTTLTPILNKAGQVVSVLGMAQDFTEKKDAHEKARRQEAELAHVLRLHTLGEMTSTFAHELNQPLCSILSFATGCIRLIKSDSIDKAKLTMGLETIAAQTERADVIIHRLRRLARKTEPHRVEADINRLVQNVLTLVQADIRSSKTTLKLELAQDIPVTFVDTIQIEQVILNIVRNALEAMGASPPKDHKLTIRTSQSENNTIDVSFRDTGEGMSPNIKTQIFDSFFTTKPNGLGLGLSLCRSIIESHRGKLYVASNPEGGSTFAFTLPVRPQDTM